VVGAVKKPERVGGKIGNESIVPDVSFHHLERRPELLQPLERLFPFSDTSDAFSPWVYSDSPCQ
jgi:hypothetical protein